MNVFNGLAVFYLSCLINRRKNFSWRLPAASASAGSRGPAGGSGARLLRLVQLSPLDGNGQKMVSEKCNSLKKAPPVVSYSNFGISLDLVRPRERNPKYLEKIFLPKKGKVGCLSPFQVSFHASEFHLILSPVNFLCCNLFSTIPSFSIQVLKQQQQN